MTDPKCPTDPIDCSEASSTVRDGVTEEEQSQTAPDEGDQDPLPSNLREIMEMTTNRMRGEYSERAEAQKPDFSFLDQIYQDQPATVERVKHHLISALKTLDERKEFVFQARERAAMALHAEREKMQSDVMQSPKMITQPTAGEVSRFMAPAMTEFLQIRLRHDEFDIRTSLAFSAKEKPEATQKPVHWITVIGFRVPNPRGGHNTVNNDEHQLFVDAADKMPSKNRRITVAPVSEIQKYGLEIFDPNKNEHASNHRAIEQLSMAGRSNFMLDRYSHLVFKVMDAPSALEDYRSFPDLYAEALLKAMQNGNMPSDKVMAQLFAMWKKG